MIRACLLDMGNVLVRFSHDRMCAQIGALCGKSAEETRRLLIDSGLQWDFERGRIAPAEFHRRFCDAVGAGNGAFDEEALRHAGSDIFDPQPGILALLDVLRGSGRRLVLFSNTCRPHFEFVQRAFDFVPRFDACVLSYEVGALKPEGAMFAAAREAIGCDPAECFYTDDVPAYVSAARALGFQAEVFTGVAELRGQLERRGVL